MDKDGDTSMDEYIVTAIQIFDCCGVKRSGTLRVDALMDKFAPLGKTNKSEYSYLRSLLDPDQSNPEITVAKLAATLNEYSESQKIKVDLEESFNLKSGQATHDSDSGISTDGFQLLEDLQCELREKSHLALQLRSQLDFTDRQHEEALAALSAERDSLRAHLNMLREENVTLTHVRRDYEDVCERLCGSERALDEARKELDGARKRARVLHEQVVMLENEKLTLKEQLTKSKDECHRINEMYASRQATLLEDNETLRTEHADLSARLQDQEEFMQQIIKEKVRLEMELKEMLNKSNQTHLRMDRSIDVSYTEDQMLTALDSLNCDSRFVQEHHIIDEESFVNALKEDQGRPTNISLFDEIRLSFCNMSRTNIAEQLFPEKPSEIHDNSLVTVATQTDEGYDENELKDTNDKVEIGKTNALSQTDKSVIAVATQTDDSNNEIEPYVSVDKIQFCHVNANISIGTQTHIDLKDANTACTQSDIRESDSMNNNHIQSCLDCSKCAECVKLQRYSSQLECDASHLHQTMFNMQLELDKYDNNLDLLKQFIEEGNNRNTLLQEAVDCLKSKLVVLESACNTQEEEIQKMCCETCEALVQTDSEVSSVSTQAELPCLDCLKKKDAIPSRRLKKFLWEPLKWLFQIFAVVCFACAVCALYGVTRRSRACDPREPRVPWRWLDAQELLDLLLSIEYVADVPM